MNATYTLLSADQVTMSDLRDAMVDAFSDYAIPSQPSLDDFAFMMRQRGFCPETSVVAVDAGQVVALWLMSIRADASYLIVSGTRPTYRGQKIAWNMAQHTLDKLRAQKVASFQTEVLLENPRAAALYYKLGMTRRRLVSYFEIPALHAKPIYEVQRVHWSAICDEVDALRDWSPTWQNANPSLDAVADDLEVVCLRDGNGLAGFAVKIKRTATLAQIAVRPDCRRRGMTRALVSALSEDLPQGHLRVINADAADTGFTACMTALSAREASGQEELYMQL